MENARDTHDFRGTAGKISIKVLAVLPYRKRDTTNAALSSSENAI